MRTAVRLAVRPDRGGDVEEQPERVHGPGPGMSNQVAAEGRSNATSFGGVVLGCIKAAGKYPFAELFDTYKIF